MYKDAKAKLEKVAVVGESPQIRRAMELLDKIISEAQISVNELETALTPVLRSQSPCAEGVDENISVVPLAGELQRFYRLIGEIVYRLNDIRHRTEL